MNATYQDWLKKNATVSKADASELLARWILQKHAKALAVHMDVKDVTLCRLLDAIDTITTPHMEFPT